MGERRDGEEQGLLPRRRIAPCVCQVTLRACVLCLRGFRPELIARGDLGFVVEDFLDSSIGMRQVVTNLATWVYMGLVINDRPS